jgi:hypothetical protein
MLAGGPAAMVADMKQQADEAKSVHEQQVQYFNAYTQAMSEVDNSTPSFGPDSLGLPPDGTFGATKMSSVAGSGSVAGAYAVGSFGPATGAQLGGVDSAGRASAFGAHLGAPGGVDGPAGVGGAGAPGGPGGVPAGPGAVSGAGAAAAAQTPVPSSSGGGGGAALGVGLGLAGAGLGAAAGKAALGRGSKTGAKQNPDETAAASTDQTQQPGHGAAGNVQQGPLMSANGTIGGNSTPPPGMGGMGGAGAHGEEDQEHTRASYLVEADPDEAFGANTATAPPVIGAWSDEDEE